MTGHDGDGEAGSIALRPRLGPTVDEATADGTPGECHDLAVARARRLLLTREREVRDEQLERALATADLTDRERAALATLADRLTARLLAGPRRSLRTAPDRDRTAATVLELFE